MAKQVQLINGAIDHLWGFGFRHTAVHSPVSQPVWGEAGTVRLLEPRLAALFGPAALPSPAVSSAPATHAAPAPAGPAASGRPAGPILGQETSVEDRQDLWPGWGAKGRTICHHFSSSLTFYRLNYSLNLIRVNFICGFCWNHTSFETLETNTWNYLTVPPTCAVEPPAGVEDGRVSELH